MMLLIALLLVGVGLAQMEASHTVSIVVYGITVAIMVRLCPSVNQSPACLHTITHPGFPRSYPHPFAPSPSQVGLHEVAVSMSDPFGEDAVDLDVKGMLATAEKNVSQH